MPKSKQEKLDQIAKEIENCEACKKDTVGVAVPGEGDPNADVVFVGEAPGKQEAKEGRPFIGRAGKILRSLIKKVGLKPRDVFITSALKYLPKHKTPKPGEIEHGRKYLFKQLDIIKPKIIVLLGRVAVESVLDRKVYMSKEHGKIIEQDGRKYLIAYHPAAPLYSNRVKKDLEKDFKKLKEIVG